VTVFLNSHFLSEVEVTCDRVAIVKHGRMVRIGTLDELTRGAMEVEIRAAGLTAELVAGLEKWGKVISDFGLRISEVDSAIRNGDVVRLILSVESDAVLPAVADWLVGAGARVYALAPQRPSLEELFMRVMRETEPAGAEQP